MDSRKLIYLLWTVIVVLIVGSITGAYFLIHNADQVGSSNIQLKGANDSLKRQVKEARDANLPTPTQVSITDTPNPPTPTPAAHK